MGGYVEVTTQGEEIAQLRSDLKAHEIWDLAEHASLKLAHESDYRELVNAINSLRVTMQGEANKIILVMLGTALSTVGGVLIFIVPHIH
jgi:hypothetical protein